MGVLYGDDTVIPEEAEFSNQELIGIDEIRKATEILNKYKQGKANLENRLVEDELWWELRHWEAIGRNNEEGNTPKPTSAWLHNTVVNKHADVMDNMPMPVVLPRERSDEESAKILTDILPVILERCRFQKTYSYNSWEKLKHGTGVYGVFWDHTKDNGLGDITIKDIDLLNIYWQPGIKDIQDSRNIFVTSLVDTDLLEENYPEYKGKLGSGALDVKEYRYDESIDNSDKSVVVDWYYKVTNPFGKTIVHFCKFVGDVVLDSSENNPDTRETGIYDHGCYPFVFDCMFPEKGTPVGFGLVAIDKDPQLYIDDLSGNILESSMMGTKKRFFASNNTGINEDEFLDWTKPIVHVEGQIDDARLREIVVQPLAPIYFNVMQQKIEEMKDTSGNRDANNGSIGGGVTAAAAISALQEAGNKSSRDMINNSYESFQEITRLVLELIRQFYDETRSFRILEPNTGDYNFVDFNNANIRDQMIGIDDEGNNMYRTPIFDLKIKAVKRNPFSRMEENERAKDLYAMGFFNPDRATESLIALEMMDFEGIDKVREKVAQGQTLLNIINQLSMQNQQMAAMLGLAPAMPSDGGLNTNEAPNATKDDYTNNYGTYGDGGKGNNHSHTDNILKSRTQQKPYAQKLVNRSTPKV